MPAPAILIREIEARVRPTICPTYTANGKGSLPDGRLEGRISAEDFDMLVTLAGAATFLHPRAATAKSGG